MHGFRENLAVFPQDLKLAVRSLLHAKGLSITVILTLALGIGANAAIFSLVRAVLLRPLVNRDEDRLLYFRHSASDIQTDNVNFSVPEMQDLRSSMKSVSELGDFSVIGFTMVGLGEPREVTAGVVGGTYFRVIGLMANIVTSSHHLSATMVTGRVHRVTELFGRLAPGATIESVRAELQTVMRTDPVMKFIDVSTAPRRIIGIAADVEDENIQPGPALTIYQPFEQAEIWGGRLFVHAHVLTPNRLNTVVFEGVACVALAIAVVGVAGVLAFSVSARTRELGIRLAIGSPRRQMLGSVIKGGAAMAALGIVAGAIGGFVLARRAASYLSDLQMPGFMPVLGARSILLVAAIVASALPAARAARIDVMEALRTD